MCSLSYCYQQINLIDIVYSDFQDLDIWHTIGLWHYSTPGLFIFAQYVLGALVATEIFASNSIVSNLSENGLNEEVSGSSEQGTLFA
jgi:hypothetical protein